MAGEGVSAGAGGLPARRVQLLPAAVEHNGAAAVERYFEPIVREAREGEGGRVLAGALRGRKLEGVEAELPDGFSGVVVQNFGPPGGAPRWRRRAAFESMRVWRVEVAPDAEGDGMLRALGSLAAARAIAKPVDSARIERAVEDMRENKRPRAA